MALNGVTESELQATTFWRSGDLNGWSLPLLPRTHIPLLPRTYNGGREPILIITLANNKK